MGGRTVSFYNKVVISMLCAALSLAVLANGSEARTNPMNYTASGASAAVPLRSRMETQLRR